MVAEFRIPVIIDPKQAEVGAGQIRKALEFTQARANALRQALLRMDVGELGTTRNNTAAVSKALSLAEQRAARLKAALGGVRLDSRPVEAAGRRVEGQLKRIQDQANRSRQTIATIFSAFGLTIVVRQLTQVLDAFTSLQNRLRVVTSDQESLTRVTKQLLDVSNRTRTSIRSNAELFTRLSIAAKELGINEEQAVRFTESLNQAIIISGATSLEAKGAITQLTQGLASGTLRGDELRSVLEQLPVVADVIAARLGVTRNELKDLGREGKISARAVIEGFQDAEASLSERFGKTIPTIAQSFEVLSNAFIIFIGKVESSTAVTAKISNLLLFLAKNIDVVGAAAQAVAVVIGVALARQAIGLLISQIGLVGIAVRANPLGALLTAAIALKAALFETSDELEKLRSQVDAFASTVSGGNLAKRIEEALGAKRIKTDSKEVQEVLGDLAARVNSLVALKGPEKLGARIAFIQQELNKLDPTKVESLVLAIRKFDDQVARNRTGESVVSTIAPPTPPRRSPIPEISKQEDLEKQEKDFNAVAKAVRELTNEQTMLEMAVGGSTEAQQEAFEITQKLIDENVRFNPIIRDQIQILSNQNQTLRIRAQLLEELNGPITALVTQGPQLLFLFESGAISAGQFDQKMRALRLATLELDDSFSGGLSRGLLQIGAQLQETGRLLETTLVNAFGAAEDAIVGFVRTGQFNFESFVNSILDDLARLLARLLLLQSLQAFLPGAGSALGITAGFAGRASGGPVEAGVPVFVGEKGTELFVPPTSGTIVPAGPTAELARNANSAQQSQVIQAPAPAVNVQVVNVTDPSEIPAGMDSPAGDRVIMNSITRQRNNARRLLS